jgi:hypothetical protein
MASKTIQDIEQELRTDAQTYNNSLQELTDLQIKYNELETRSFRLLRNMYKLNKHEHKVEPELENTYEAGLTELDETQEVLTNKQVKCFTMLQNLFNKQVSFLNDVIRMLKTENQKLLEASNSTPDNL